MKRMLLMTVVAGLAWAGGTVWAQVTPVQIRVDVGGSTDYRYEHNDRRLGRGKTIAATIRSKQLDVTLTNITGKPLVETQVQMVIFGAGGDNAELTVARLDEKTVTIAGVQPARLKSGTAEFVDDGGRTGTKYAGYAVVVRQGEVALGAKYDPPQMKEQFQKTLEQHAKQTTTEAKPKERPPREKPPR